MLEKMPKASMEVSSAPPQEASRCTLLCRGWFRKWTRSKREKARSRIPVGSALDRILQGCQMLNQYDLPPRAAALVLEIEANADRLLPMIRTDDDDFLPAIWSRPEPREQSEWEQVCVGGGSLLHSQGCIFAIGLTSEEWLMGRFFVSDRGVGIQGSSGACIGRFEVALWTGLLHWHGIEAVERDDDSDISLRLTEGTFRDTVIRLQLGGSQAEFERLEKAWQHYAEGRLGKFYSFATCSRGSMSIIVEEGMMSKLTPAQPCSIIKADAPFTQSFVVATNSLPERLQNNQAIVSDRIPDVSLEKVRKVLEKDDDWFMCRFQIDVLKAFDMKPTSWTAGQIVPGTLVRRLNFKLPKPDDIPKAVANVIGFPDVLESTLAARLQCEEDAITLHMHSCAFNAPYGDYQRLEDVLVFKADGEGGTIVSKFMKIVWVKPCPWHLNMVRGVLETKVKSDGKDTFQQFLGVLRSEAAKLAIAA